MARHRTSYPPFDQINVTPLIDTLFFLLIIFMLTAPLLEYSMDVVPPSNNANQIKTDDRSLTVNVRRDGVIVFENKEMTPDTLAARLRELRASDKKYHFYLRADGSLLFSQVIGTIRDIKNAGFTEIALVTAAED